jgi:hypothetical protein
MHSTHCQDIPYTNANPNNLKAVMNASVQQQPDYRTATNSNMRSNIFQFWHRRPRGVGIALNTSPATQLQQRPQGPARRVTSSCLSIQASRATRGDEAACCCCDESEGYALSFITAPTAAISSVSILSTATTPSMIGLLPVSDPALPTGETAATATTAEDGAATSSSTPTTTATIRALPPPVSYQLVKNINPGFGFLRFAAERVPCDALSGLAVEHEKPICSVHVDLIPEGDAKLGNDVFSDPLIVEALETLFVLVTVDGDPDDRVRYPEGGCFFTPTADSSPACVTPAVMFLDQNCTPLAASISYFNLCKHTILQAMIDALQASQRKVPRYLRLISEEAIAYCSRKNNRVRQAVFGFSNVRQAEVEFAGLEGVLGTVTGTLLSSKTSKIVQVTYDSSRLTYGKVTQHALRFAQANKTQVRIHYKTNDERMAAQIESAKHEASSVALAAPYEEFAIDRLDLKTALRFTPMRSVPATELQKAKANRSIHQGRFDEACHVLSPRQGLILMQATRMGSKAFYDVVDVPMQEAWVCLCNNEDPRKPVINDDDSDPDTAPEIYNLLGQF